MVTKVKEALDNWRSKNITFLSHKLQADFKTEKTMTYSNVSDDYSLYSEDQVIMERAEEEESEDISRSGASLLAKSDIYKSQLLRQSAQKSIRGSSQARPSESQH